MKRNKFSLSHYQLLSMDMGELVPLACMEVLPGDTFQQATSALIRVSPLLAPVMHPVTVSIHHWFIPNRLVWEDWEDFITGGPDGMNASQMPFIDFGISTIATGSLACYLGCPPVANVGSVSALPFRAYSLIWNEFYRDQDLQSELTIDLTSGQDTTTNTVLQNVNWEKDYFTSSRPWPAKGPDITIPMAGTAPVTFPTRPSTWRAVGGAQNNQLLTGANGNNVVAWSSASTVTANRELNMPTDAYADLSNTTGASINDLREAFALQRYEEARARYGSRYVEYLRYLGVRSSDARLQRPEYLGGGRQTIQFSEVLQTGVTTSGDPEEGVGNMRGHGIAALRSNRYRRFFEEHGYVISLMSVRPKTMYMDGLHRSWTRGTKEDYWQRELEHIGQQEILNREIYAPHASPGGTFGYQDRYDEYRRCESRVSGDFALSLNYWHYARSFGSAPALNADFVKSVPTKRVNQDQTSDVLWVMAKHSIQARRPVSRSTKSFVL